MNYAVDTISLFVLIKDFFYPCTPKCISILAINFCLKPCADEGLQPSAHSHFKPITFQNKSTQN